MYNLIYFFALIVLTCGLFMMLTQDNYVRKIIGLGIFQGSVLIFYLALGKVNTGVVPIISTASPASSPVIFTSPLPHVLMLTAIVVGFATLSVGLALIYRIYQNFGSISEEEVNLIIKAEENSNNALPSSIVTKIKAKRSS